MKSTLGVLEITANQAEELKVLPHRQISPHLENCCLRLSATVSYEQAEQDLAYLTGIRVPAKTQQRIVIVRHLIFPILSSRLRSSVSMAVKSE